MDLFLVTTQKLESWPQPVRPSKKLQRVIFVITKKQKKPLRPISIVRIILIKKVVFRTS